MAAYANIYARTRIEDVQIVERASLAGAAENEKIPVLQDRARMAVPVGAFTLHETWVPRASELSVLNGFHLRIAPWRGGRACCGDLLPGRRFCITDQYSIGER